MKNSVRDREGAGKVKDPRAKIPATEITGLVMKGGKVVEGTIVGPQLSSLFFWNDPPHPDPLFAPFYMRALTGDLLALVEFYRMHSSKLSDAFFQCMGYLATVGSHQEMKVVEKIMKINARGGPHRSSVAKRKSIRDWEQRVLPTAQVARRWISEQRQAEKQERNRPSGREQLWKNYLQRNITPKDSPAFPALLRNFDYEGTVPVGDKNSLKLNPKELRDQQRDFQRFITSLSLSYGVIPKPLFFMLARTAPQRLSPSVVVRRFVQKLVV